MNRPDSEIEAKGRQSIRLLNETLQHSANEPALALYRIQVNSKKKPNLKSFSNDPIFSFRNIRIEIYLRWYNDDMNSKLYKND